MLKFVVFMKILHHYFQFVFTGFPGKSGNAENAANPSVNSCRGAVRCK